MADATGLLVARGGVVKTYGEHVVTACCTASTFDGRTRGVRRADRAVGVGEEHAAAPAGAARPADQRRDPDRGQRHDGSSDDARSDALRGRTIGFVFQFHHLLPAFTAARERDDARDGRPRARWTTRCRRRAGELLARVGLEDRMRLPRDQPVGRAAAARGGRAGAGDDAGARAGRRADRATSTRETRRPGLRAAPASSIASRARRFSS